MLALCVLFSALASIFLKMAVSGFPQPVNILAIITTPMLWFGAAFYGAAFLGYVYILRIVPLTLAQPVITSGVSVLTAVLAVILFREQLLLINWIGLALICTGIFFLFLGRT
jgi:multidrug transporter EmrE-like cation transporter